MLIELLMTFVPSKEPPEETEVDKILANEEFMADVRESLVKKASSLRAENLLISERVAL